MARVTEHREEHVNDVLHLACVTAYREEHVKLSITRGSCYSSEGITCEAMHYTWLVLQNTGKNM